MTSPEKEKGLYSAADLCMSAMFGESKWLEKAVESGANVNRKHEITGLCPLHCAVKGRSVRCVQFLLKQKETNVNCLSENGETPLHFAVKNAAEMNLTQEAGKASDSLVICEQLVKNGGDILALTADGQTPLHYALGAINSSTVSLLKVLLENDTIGKYDAAETMCEFDAAQSTAASALHSLYKEINSSTEFQLDSDDRLLLMKRSLAEVRRLFSSSIGSKPERFVDLIKVAQRLLAVRAVMEQHGEKLITDGFGLELKSVLLHCVHSQIFENVLQTRKTFDERTLCVWISQSVSLACKTDEFFSFANITLPSKSMVQLFNRFSDPYVDQPLRECLESLNSYYWPEEVEVCYAQLQKLLNAGFDPNVPLIRASYYFPRVETCPLALLQHNLFAENYTSNNLISFVIEMTQFDSKTKLKRAYESIRLLLEYGASANARTDNELSPLVFFCNKKRLNFTDEIIGEIIDLLLSSGADLNHRSRGSVFKCSDFVLAAVTGEYFAHEEAGLFVKEMGLNPIDVLTDLSKFSCPVFSFFEPADCSRSRSRLMRNIAAFMSGALKYVVKTARALQMLRTINTQLVGSEISKEVADILHFHAFFDGTVPALQSLCRQTIRETVANGKLCDMKERIEQLPYPQKLKNYLMFES